MDFELLTCLLKFIKHFPDYHSVLSRMLLRFFWTTFIETAVYIYIYIYIYIDEGVRPVAWQQCKHSLFDVREREGCQAATDCETGWRQRQFAVAMQLVKSGQDWFIH